MDSSRLGFNTFLFWTELTIFYPAAFEGLAHPYKENIVKVGNDSVIGNLPEVQETLQKAKAAPSP
jgi:hypothetical protein